MWYLMMTLVQFPHYPQIVNRLHFGTQYTWKKILSAYLYMIIHHHFLDKDWLIPAELEERSRLTIRQAQIRKAFQPESSTHVDSSEYTTLEKAFFI